MTRKFNEALFCGAGQHTRRQVQDLHDRLDKAIALLSGTQQSPHWERPPTQEQLAAEAQQNEEARLYLREFIRDVAMALTGLEVEFRESPILG